MITYEGSGFLMQMIESILEKTNDLELAYKSENYGKMKEIKEFILKAQIRINEILEKSKK